MTILGKERPGFSFFTDPDVNTVLRKSRTQPASWLVPNPWQTFRAMKNLERSAPKACQSFFVFQRQGQKLDILGTWLGVTIRNPDSRVESLFRLMWSLDQFAQEGNNTKTITKRLPGPVFFLYFGGLVQTRFARGRNGPPKNQTRKEERMAKQSTPCDEFEFIYRKFITLRNGKRLYASAYGRKAFRLKVRKR